MIHEYALEPEMVATWGSRYNYRLFIREFGLGQGRIVSRYPKKWARKVWDTFSSGSDMDRKRMEELLVTLQNTMIKRKDCVWDDEDNWLQNALVEHERHSFRAILARSNPDNIPAILSEDDLASSICERWDCPHGMVVNRRAPDMVSATETMLARCRWVKFIDPYISPSRQNYRLSLQAFLNILAAERPVGLLESVEIHTGKHDATADFLRKTYEALIPAGLQVNLFQWQERDGGQRLHNRYILTDLGGVSFHHGLDTGEDGETDDISRLDREQYELRCRQYDSAAPAFDPAASPFIVDGLG